MTVMELSNGFETMEADELYFINGGKVSRPDPREIDEKKDLGNKPKEQKEPKENAFLKEIKETSADMMGGAVGGAIGGWINHVIGHYNK